MSLLDRLDAAALCAYRETFQAQGVIWVPQLLERRWIDILDEIAACSIERPTDYVEDFAAGTPGGRFFADVGLAARFPSFETFLVEAPAAELAAALLQSSAVRLFFEQIIVKEAGASKRTPWHQDLPYWPIAGSKICSMWIPVDPIPKDVSVEFVAGSHAWREHRPVRFQNGAPYGDASLPLLPDIDACREALPIVSFAMAPGDCLVFDARIVHGAPGNDRPAPRRAISIRWVGDGVRHRPGAGPGAPAEGELLDGEDYPVLWPRPGSPS